MKHKTSNKFWGFFDDHVLNIKHLGITICLLWINSKMKVSLFLLAVLFATANSVPFRVEKSSDSQGFMVSRQYNYKTATKHGKVSPAHYWDTPHQYFDKEGREKSYDRSSQNCSSDQKRSTKLSSLSAANLQNNNLVFHSRQKLARLNRHVWKQ